MTTIASVATLNTWCNCIPPHDEVIPTIVRAASNNIVVGLQEVHKRGSPRDAHSRFQKPFDEKGRPGPIDIELYNELENQLRRTHRLFFVSHFLNALHDCEATTEQVEYGNLLLVQRGWHVVAYTTLPISGLNNLNQEDDLRPIGIPASRSAQIVTISNHHHQISVMNVHGLWSKRGKVDTPSRFAQSTRIATLARRHTRRAGAETPLIILGDFNYTSNLSAYQSLVSNTEVFGLLGGVCLNKRFGVTRTRTHWYPEDKPTQEADFMVVSPDLAERCTDYQVDYGVPSDHAMITGTFRFS